MIARLGQVVWSIWLCFFYALQDLAKRMRPTSFAKSVKNEIVLVTGGGSGLGRLVAKKLAKLGATVVVWDINEWNMKETVKEIEECGGRCHAYLIDLRHRQSIYDTAARVRRDIGRVSILINNAGIVSGTLFLDTPDDEIQRTLDINLMAYIWTVKAFLPDMIDARKGHVVNVASLAGYFGTNQLVDYSCSKFGVVGFDDALRSELAFLGLAAMIKLTLICPYYTDTGMFSGVESTIVPILRPEFVSDQMVTAIQLEREIVMLPWYLALVVTLKTILPSRGFSYFSTHVFNIDSTMKRFRRLSANG